jgi:hypothetical protein
MTTKVGVFGGNIGVGTNDPGNYDLDVVGSLRANTVDFGDAANAHIPSGFIMIWKGFRSIFLQVGLYVMVLTEPLI